MPLVINSNRRKTMGRPLHSKLGGNVTGSGNQLRVMAHLDAVIGPEPCWINKQTGSTRFNVSSVAGGATPTRTGTIYLVGNDEPALNEGYIKVLPVAIDDGGGALFTATMLVVGATIVDGGTGYAGTDTLTVVGGTAGTAATLTVDTVSTGVITVISIADGQDYTVLPTNPVSVTGGTGNDDATFNLTYGIESVAVDQGGDDWSTAPTLQVIGNGSSGAVSATLTSDVITSVAVDTIGTGYTSIPRIATAVAGTRFATKLHDNIVKTTDGTIYSYPGEAVFDQD